MWRAVRGRREGERERGGEHAVGRVGGLGMGMPGWEVVLLRRRLALAGEVCLDAEGGGRVSERGLLLLAELLLLLLLLVDVLLLLLMLLKLELLLLEVVVLLGGLLGLAPGGVLRVEGVRREDELPRRLSRVLSVSRLPPAVDHDALGLSSAARSRSSLHDDLAVAHSSAAGDARPAHRDASSSHVLGILSLGLSLSLSLGLGVLVLAIVAVRREEDGRLRGEGLRGRARVVRVVW